MVADTESKCGGTAKFLCSYGGKILPRTTDGKLRYVGGLTRVLSVDRSISFAELMVKLEEFCGYSVNLRCQLPNGDLETLISVKSDEDLANIMEEYDRVVSGNKKIIAVLYPPSSLKRVSPSSSVDLSPESPYSSTGSPSVLGLFSPRCYWPPVVFPVGVHQRPDGVRCCGCHFQGIRRSRHCSSHCCSHWH